MSTPLWMLVPWALFALAAGVKIWQLSRWLRQPSPSSLNSTERFRAALERRWEREQNTA